MAMEGAFLLSCWIQVVPSKGKRVIWISLDGFGLSLFTLLRLPILQLSLVESFQWEKSFLPFLHEYPGLTDSETCRRGLRDLHDWELLRSVKNPVLQNWLSDSSHHHHLQPNRMWLRLNTLRRNNSLSSSYFHPLTLRQLKTRRRPQVIFVISS